MPASQRPHSGPAGPSRHSPPSQRSVAAQSAVPVHALEAQRPVTLDRATAYSTGATTGGSRRSVASGTPRAGPRSASRLTPASVIPAAEIPVPDGWGIFSGGKGHFGVHQLNAGAHQQISFSLVRASEPVNNYNFTSAGLTMNRNDSDAVGGALMSVRSTPWHDVPPLPAR